MHINITRLKAIANTLSLIEDEFVFVGGAVVALYARDNLGVEVRPTDDVDVIVEIASYADYTKFEEKLLSVGFVNDYESGVLCRYKIAGITVDIMPTDSRILGFSNIWYPDGFKNAMNYDLGQGLIIKIFSLPYFIASKWEAFKSRGGGDYRTSKDFEDIVYIFENVLNIGEHFVSVPSDLSAYFKNEFATIINQKSFAEGLYAHMDNNYFDQDVEGMIQRFKKMFDL